jgi:hypothetical protein
LLRSFGLPVLVPITTMELQREPFKP